MQKMNELQNIILNSVKNPSYFQQLNINDLIDDESIKDELLNILQIIVANSTKQSNRLKNDMDELSINNIESDKNNSFINLFNEKESIFGFDSCLINYQKFLAKNNLGHTIGINI